MIIKNKRGFTLLETVVVIAIIGIIASVSNFSFRTADRSTLLNSAVEQFINDFERMRSNAINGVFPDANTRPVSYGIYTDDNFSGGYWTFTDLNDYKKDVAESTKIDLPEGIEISSPTNGKSDLAFELFTANFYYEGVLSTNNKFFVLTDTQSGITKSININEDGLIVSIPACGDTVIQVGEQCDDGAAVSNDECSFNCQIEWCGDGILQNNVRPRNADGSYKQPNNFGMKEQCDTNDPTPTWDTITQFCNTICQVKLRGGGGGGCMITPYTPKIPPNISGSQGQFFLFLLLPIPFFFKLWLRRLGKNVIRRRV